MTKLSRKKLPSEVMGNYINNLWSVFTLAHSKEDIRLLFKDLFSHTEYKMFAKRFEIARLLINGEKYYAIEKSMCVTPVTIAKISNILEEKGEGLRKAIANLNKLEDAYWARQKELTKDLENPSRKKIKNRMLLSRALIAGMGMIDKKVSRVNKDRSAAKNLDI